MISVTVQVKQIDPQRIGQCREFGKVFTLADVNDAFKH
jgi:hypothetical protein